MRTLSTVIIETNSLDKKTWAYIYSLIELIESKKHNSLKIKNDVNFYYLENSKRKKRIYLPIGTRITETNLGILNNGIKDYLIIYNHNKSHRNFQEFISFFNLIDIYNKRISLAINLKQQTKKERLDYYFTICQFLLPYRGNKNIRNDEQIYFIYDSERIKEETGEIINYKTEKIASKKDISKNISIRFSNLLKITIETFYELFSLTPSQISINESKCKNIIESIKKYDKFFEKKLKSKNESKILKNHIRLINSWEYKNIFSEYFIKSFFFHLLEENKEEFNSINNIDKLFYLLSKYTDGIEELIENIIYHTHKKIGYFYFEFIKKKNINDEKFTENINKINNVSRILKICIYDFSSQGILDTFKEKITLEDLYNPKKIIEKDTHLDLRYTAHTGLKIFQKNIINNLGTFTFETNNSKKGSKIKYELIHDKPEPKITESYNNSIDGTHYEILLPISENLIKNLPTENYITYQSQPFNYTTWLKKTNKISCIDLTNYLPEIESQQSYKIELIKKVGDKIINDYEKQNNLAIDYNSMGIFKIESFFFKFLSYLQLRASNYFQIIIISNVTKELIDNINERIKILIETRQKIWNDHTALVLFTKELYIPYIITGETPSKITSINRLLRIYYPSINHFNFTNEKDDNELINSSNKFIQPYELIVYKENNNIFENYVANILENEIEKDKIGYKLKAKNFLIGSKIITENYYEADTIFQNSFFVDRFAFLIAKQILDKKFKNIVLLGYGLYSEFLLNTIKSFLEKTLQPTLRVRSVIIGKNIDNNEWIFRGETKDNFKNRFSEYSFITIVPIGSTLSTNDKIISKFLQALGLRDFTPSEIQKKFTNFSVILVRDKCGNKITEKESIYWESIQDKTISTKFTFASKVRFFVGKSGNWNNIFNKDVSFPKNFSEEKPILRTKLLSINSYRTIGWTRVKKIDNKTFKLELERLKTFKDYTLIHHFDWNKSHLHYYFDTEAYINKEKNRIEKWIKKIGEGINKKFNGLNVIITPNNNIESSFVKLVNKELFDNNAVIIYMDIYSDIRNNIIHKYSFLKKIERKDKENKENKETIFKVNFHFIDHVLSTGDSARKARSYISSIMDENRPFESIITLINRLSYYRNQEIIGYKEEEQKRRTKIFEYVNLFIPPIKTPETDCSICASIKRYTKLKEQTSIKKLSFLLEKKINKLKTIALEVNENKKKYLATERNFKRFILTHNIFYNISALNADHKKILKYLTNLGNSEDVNFKINFVKVLSTQPLINYQHIKTFVFGFMLNELEKLLSSKNYNIISFNYLLTLLKYLSELEANAFIRKELIIKVWYYYFEFCKTIDIKQEIKNVIKNIRDLQRNLKSNNIDLLRTQEINDDCKKQLKLFRLYMKTKRNIEDFNILFHLFVNNVTFNSEAKSLWLGELLRTGEENKNFFNNNYNLSKTEENNSLFDYFKNKEIKDDLLSKYKNFLVWIKYDNTVILRKTLQRLKEELQRNIKLRNYFFKEQTEILFPLDKLNIADIKNELSKIIQNEYYHQYIHKYLSFDSPPVLDKLIYTLYGKLLFEEFNQEQHNKELLGKIYDILNVFSKIMDANAAFMVLRKLYENNKFRIIKTFGINENGAPYIKFNKYFNTPDYSYTFYQLNNRENFYPIVSNNTLEKTSENEKFIYGEKNELKFKAINVLRIYNSYSNNKNNKNPIGAITFLYSKNNITDKQQSFSTYSKELGVFLMLLQNDFNNFIKEAYNKHSISELINNINNQEKFDRIYINTDHRYGSNTRKSIEVIYQIANTNPKLIAKLIYPFLTFSDNTISWLYSKVEKYSGDLNNVGTFALKEDSSFLTVFNKSYSKFLKYISDNNFRKWSGYLKIEGFELKDDFDLKWDIEILRSFIILLIKNAMYSHFPLSQKRITLTFSATDNTIKITNNFPDKKNIKDFQKKKTEFLYKKSSILNLDIDDYSSTTLTSLVAYCKYLNLNIDFDYDEEDNFYVKFNII